MKHIIIYIIILLSTSIGYGQLHKLSNQYVFNGLAINPAYAGSEDALSSSLMYRNQWTGFEGAPKTLTGALHTPLRNERVGVGLLVVHDQIGIHSETSILANYAYLIEMGEGRLSFGVSMGVTLLDVAWDKLEANDKNDTELLSNMDQLTNPNFGAGLYYKTNDFYFGLSIPSFLSYAYNSNNNQIDLKNDISQYNYHIVGGYGIDLNRDVRLFPSVLVKYHAENAFQVDINTQLIFNDRLWVGFTYRSEDAMAALTQIAITNQLRIAYSYDFNIGKTNRYYGGSHEVMLKFVLDFKARVVGPKRF